MRIIFLYSKQKKRQEKEQYLMRLETAYQSNKEILNPVTLVEKIDLENQSMRRLLYMIQSTTNNKVIDQE